MTIESKPVELEVGSTPPWCLGPGGKFNEETESERRKRIESARQRRGEIAGIPTTPMILRTRNGYERTMSFVRIGRSSKEDTKRRGRLCSSKILVPACTERCLAPSRTLLG
jgi:hypothetical protein